MLFKLTGDERIQHRCATEGCWQQVSFKLEASDIGAFYCSPCAEKIEQILDPATPTKGTVEGFTDELREICREACAENGDPPCWQLPDMTSDCDGKVIKPCPECLITAGFPYCGESRK